MRWIRTIILTLAAGAALGPAHAAEEAPSVETLQAGIESKHPATYYQLAAALLKASQADEAVFWFYAGQLRYRTHLLCLDETRRQGEMPLFSALSETVGRPVNEYAFGDVETLSKTLARVLAWDETTPDGFLSRAECADALAKARSGLEKLRQRVIDEADTIRQERTKNGLPNRT